ncbi:MAG: UDP-N-acetylglucosamine diphosphorylase [Candidatus Levybacteria bacterium]|nr:UDP-N-acetylglucosamine diphosphorylase [Candidatus Levybacteria bacterium]
MTSFSKEHFFNLSAFPFKNVFDQTEHIWDVLKYIDQYVREQFSSGKLIPNYQERNNVYIGKGTVIEEGASIKGPAIIGKNCFIAHGAYVRENVILGDDVRIWHGTEIKHTIMLNGAVGTHNGYIGDSIVGNRVNIAAGAIVANLRLDRKSVHVRHDKSKIDTGLLKFGAIIGDDCQIGVNAVLNPGTVLGKNSIVFPLVSVFGVHKEGSTIK